MLRWILQKLQIYYSSNRKEFQAAYLNVLVQNMGVDSCPRGREFESQDTSKLIVFKICLLDKTKNKRKEVGYGPFSI